MFIDKRLGNQGEKSLKSECLCRNGGMCYKSSTSGKLCQCLNGFTGPFCETSICKFDKMNKSKRNMDDFIF